MILQQIDSITQIQKFAKIIFFNFLYLQYEKNINFSLNSIIEVLQNSTLTCWLILEKGIIIAYLIGNKQLLTDGRYVFFISYLYVSENYRNKGIGTYIMLNCFKYCKENRIAFIMLISNENNFIKKFGFTPDMLMKINNKKYKIYTVMNEI
jgi:GNAT superfamily N-acetyltransferase